MEAEGYGHVPTHPLSNIGHRWFQSSPASSFLPNQACTGVPPPVYSAPLPHRGSPSPPLLPHWHVYPLKEKMGEREKAEEEKPPNKEDGIMGQRERIEEEEGGVNDMWVPHC